MDNREKPDDPHNAPTVIEADPYSPPMVQPTVAPEPRGLGDLLKDAFELYKKNAVFFIVITAIGMGPPYLLKDVIMAAFLAPASAVGASLEADAGAMEAANRELQAAIERGASPEEIQRLTARQFSTAMNAAGKSAGMLAGLLAMLGALLATLPLMALGAFLAQGALTVGVADRVRGGKMTWGGAWAVLLQRLVPLLAVSLLAAVGTLVGLVACIVPGVVFALLCSFVAPVVLLERRGPVDAVKRSIALFKADWLRTVVVLVIFGVLMGVAGWVGGLLVPDRFFFVDLVVQDLVAIALTPVGIIGLVLLYRDIRTAVLHEPATDLAQAESALLAPVPGQP